MRKNYIIIQFSKFYHTTEVNILVLNILTQYKYEYFKQVKYRDNSKYFECLEIHMKKNADLV